MVIVKTGIMGAPQPHENSEMVEVRKIIAILPWEGLAPADKMYDANYKKDKLTGNVRFPIPWPSNIVSLDDFSDSIEDVDAAITLRKTNVKGSANALQKAVKIMYNNAQNIMTMVQICMNNNVGDAIEICIGTGFEYKTITVRGKRKNSVKQGSEPGELVFECEGAGYHEFQMSVDGGVTITHLPSGSSGICIAKNLISKKEYWFRGRLILAGNAFGEWTTWVSGIAP